MTPALDENPQPRRLIARSFGTAGHRIIAAPRTAGQDLEGVHPTCPLPGNQEDHPDQRHQAHEFHNITDEERQSDMENSSITRQAVLTLGGKAPTNGTVTATKGYEFASVRTNVRVTSQRPVSTDIEFLVDVHVTERRTLAPGEGSIQLEFDFTKIVEGMPAFTVAVPPSLCGHYEAEFQLTIVERPATRQRVITPSYS